MVNPDAHIDVFNLAVISHMNHRIINHGHDIGGAVLRIHERDEIFLQERIRIILQFQRGIGREHTLIVTHREAVDKLNIQFEIHIHRVRVIDTQPIATGLQRRNILTGNGHGAARRRNRLPIIINRAGRVTALLRTLTLGTSAVASADIELKRILRINLRDGDIDSDDVILHIEGAVQKRIGVDREPGVRIVRRNVEARRNPVRVIKRIIRQRQEPQPGPVLTHKVSQASGAVGFLTIGAQLFRVVIDNLDLVGKSRIIDIGQERVIMQSDCPSGKRGTGMGQRNVKISRILHLVEVGDDQIINSDRIGHDRKEVNAAGFIG